MAMPSETFRKTNLAHDGHRRIMGRETARRAQARHAGHEARQAESRRTRARGSRTAAEIEAARAELRKRDDLASETAGSGGGSPGTSQQPTRCADTS
jgi:hypothetical protein